jgi:hypothetical protein
VLRGSGFDYISADTAAFICTGFTTQPDLMHRVHTVMRFIMPLELTLLTF